MPITNPQVESILETLRSRESEVAWIADEIVAIIERGKPSIREVAIMGQKRATEKAATTEPLNENEEMQVTLNALHSYFCEPQAMWSDTEDTIKRFFSESTVAAPRRLRSFRLLDERGKMITVTIDQESTQTFEQTLAMAQKEEA